jgi:bifunctional non-homologous end joining protein LigD
MARKAAGTPAADALAAYNAKRDFARTAEPAGVLVAEAGRRLVIQHHYATREHYDLRLEVEGVLKSWAVTRGPSANPKDRRLAVRTEDHPVSYADFEGTIPKKEYGGGTVILWEYATFTPLNGDPAAAIEAGEIKFVAEGTRMRGRWVLVKMNVEKGRENWLLIKEKGDSFVEPDDGLVARFPTSISTGRTRAEIEAGAPAKAAEPAVAAKPRRGKQQTVPAASSTLADLPFIPPMLCATAEAPPESADWLCEMKYDGYRLQLAIAGGAARLSTRTGLDWTAKFRGIAAEAAGLGCESAIVDGEAVVFDASGVSDFPALVAALEKARAMDIEFVAFDLLMLDGVDLRVLPTAERKARLKTLLKGRKTIIRYADHFVGHGPELLAAAARAGAEGIIAKRADAAYVSDRSSHWLKIKVNPREDVVIIGYNPSAAGDLFGSLLAAREVEGRLVYAGRIGTGYDAATKSALWPRLRSAEVKRPAHLAGLETPAAIPKGVRFLAQPFRAEVRYSGLTSDGQMRHARFLAAREDLPVGGMKAAAEAPMPQEKPKPAKPRAAATGAAAAPVTITHPDRVIYPRDGVTKGDVAAYYAAAASRMLPHLAGRPVSVIRVPETIEKEQFFQRHPMKGMGGVIPFDAGKDEPYFVVDGAAGLQHVAQYGGVELHGWMSRIDKPGFPDRLIFDLDPDEGLDFASVRDAAAELRGHLATVGLQTFAMVTGGKGVHVIAPLDRSLDTEAVEGFAAGFARGLARQFPQRFTATLSKEKRKGRIFIDWLRNKARSTAVLPWSLRARPGAPVAVPVTWERLQGLKAGNVFTIRSALDQPDAMADFAKVRQSIPQAAIDFVRSL